MLSHRIRRIVIFVLFVIVSCIGCDKIFEDEVYYHGATIEEAFTCISVDRPVEVDRPAEVLIRLSGFAASSGCTDRPFENIYVDRVENRISLKPTVIKRLLTGWGATCSAVVYYRGEVTLKDLEVGEYEIWANDSEPLRLRIEEETASVLLRPLITITMVEMKTSERIQRFDRSDVYPYHFPDPWIETREPVQVTIGVSGYFRYGSEIIDPLKITCIEREATEIKVDISSEVGIADCLKNQETNYTSGPSYDTEIDLGIFAVGDYHVGINGDSVSFSIRPHVRRKNIEKPEQTQIQK